MEKRVSHNTAIRALLDDGLMIGRHRPVIAGWFNNWVDEYSRSEIMMTADEDTGALEDILKDLLLKDIKDSISVTTEKVCLVEGWRPGKPIPEGAEWGQEVTVRFHGFRNRPKEVLQAAPGPDDRGMVLAREGRS